MINFTLNYPNTTNKQNNLYNVQGIGVFSYTNIVSISWLLFPCMVTGRGNHNHIATHNPKSVAQGMIIMVG